MTKGILLILTVLIINTSIFAKIPIPRRHSTITGTWRVITKWNLNTVFDIRFDSTSAVFGSYSDTYTKFTYEFISSDTLQLTDPNQHKYLVMIRKLSDNKLVLDNLFNVSKKITLERVR